MRFTAKVFQDIFHRDQFFKRSINLIEADISLCITLKFLKALFLLFGLLDHHYQALTFAERVQEENFLKVGSLVDDVHLLDYLAGHNEFYYSRLQVVGGKMNGKQG